MNNRSVVALMGVALASAALSQKMWSSESIFWGNGKPYPVTNKRGCAARQKRQAARRKARK